MSIQDKFDCTPKVKKLNVLPKNPEMKDCSKAVGPGRFPSWLHRKLPQGGNLWETEKAISENRLHTVCEEAKCPNLLECWTKKTATFLVLGKECTRACGFCDIDHNKTPPLPEKDEPNRVAASVKQLGLKHVVITMVARDDLKDGGAAHLATIMNEIRCASPETTLEILPSDLQGNSNAWDILIEAKPEIFNHNIETVRSLTPRVRHTATYDRSLAFLRYVKMNQKNSNMKVKSGIMVGLGETENQVKETIHDLLDHGCDIITIGQYLQPNRHKLRVKEFVTPIQFKKYEEFGYSIGVPHMYCGPFVRSSYNADLIIKANS